MSGNRKGKYLLQQQIICHPDWEMEMLVKQKKTFIQNTGDDGTL